MTPIRSILAFLVSCCLCRGPLKAYCFLFPASAVPVDTPPTIRFASAGGRFPAIMVSLLALSIANPPSALAAVAQAVDLSGKDVSWSSWIATVPAGKMGSERIEALAQEARSNTMVGQDRPSKHRFIEEHEIGDFRANDSDTLQRVVRKCASYATMFSAVLSGEDLDDVVAGAIVDVLPLINDHDSVERVNTELERSLGRQRKRFQRLQQAPPAERIGSRSEFDPTEQLIVRIRILRLVAGIEPAMQASLARLSERDQAILVCYYGMDEFLGTSAKNPSFSSKAAKKKACQRARERFNQHLEAELESLSVGAELNKEVLNDALRVVRGGDLEELVRSKGSF